MVSLACRLKPSRAAGRAIGAIAVTLALLIGCDLAVASPAPPPANTATAATAALNPLLNPPVSDGYRLPVAIAMRVINVSDIGEVSQRFKMVGYLLAHWKDPRLEFKPQTADERFHTYSADQIWHPRFDFVNGVVPHSAYDVTIHVFPDGTVRY